MIEFQVSKKNVLFEDNHLLVLNKPAGLLVHSDITGDVTLLDYAKQYIKKKYNKPGRVFLHPLHRLDRPVSGAIIFCRTDKALTRMQEQWKAKEPTKTYIAICEAVPNPMSGTLKHHLRKNKKINKAYVSAKNDELAKYAELDYECLGIQNRFAVLAINLKTGRPHQIRVQLAALKSRIVGDTKYGSKVNGMQGKILLHAQKIVFTHPVKKEEIRVNAALPAYWKKINSYNDLIDIAEQ